MIISLTGKIGTGKDTLETEDDINKAYALDYSCVVCIPVGKMEKIGNLYRPNINLKINNG